jgi:hypothetical protein
MQFMHPDVSNENICSKAGRMTSEILNWSVNSVWKDDEAVI